MCTVGFGAVAWDVPAWGEVEEQQVSHQGHCQQHGLQFQAYPQEDGARNEAQDAAAGVVLQVGTIPCVSHQEACLEESAASSLLLRSCTVRVCTILGPLLPFSADQQGHCIALV